MTPPIDRRAALAGSFLAVSTLSASLSANASDAQALFARLEARARGRLGVAVLNVGTGHRLAYRADERFPMCSTFKLLLAAMVLSHIDRGRESIDGRIMFGKSDILPHAPVTSLHVGPPGMTLAELCAAAVVESDNTAANLLLANFDGPSGLTTWLRAMGDVHTRLDRTELALNEAKPGDPRDTTTPASMLEDAHKIVLGKLLSPASRNLLTGWLIADRAGEKRLRAGFPAVWRAGDKTGTGFKGTVNDVAVAWPPAGGPLIVAAYMTECQASDAECEAVLAEVGKLAARMS